MSLRTKVATELGILTGLTLAFLIAFPKRRPAVDLGLAAVALTAIGLTWRYTRNVVWAAAPALDTRNRSRRCLTMTLWITVPPVLLFLAIGGGVSYQDGGWTAVSHRLINWRILAAFGAYLLWAMMQQTLFQFYLLGRLLALFPRNQPALAVVVAGVGVGMVHLPDVWTTVATVAAGIVWSFIYLRFRMLLPLAFSHAALGTAFYYGLFGQDLAIEWRSLLP